MCRKPSVAGLPKRMISIPVQRGRAAPEARPGPPHLGEYGGDGKLGTRFTNDPATRSSLLMMLQRNGPWDRLVNLRVGVKKILWE